MYMSYAFHSNSVVFFAEFSNCVVFHVNDVFFIIIHGYGSFIYYITFMAPLLYLNIYYLGLDARFRAKRSRGN